MGKRLARDRLKNLTGKLLLAHATHRFACDGVLASFDIANHPLEPQDDLLGRLADYTA